MSKYARDLDEGLVKKVKSMANTLHLNEYGICVEALRLTRGKVFGELVQGNELAKFYSGEENLIVVALNEEAFDMVDDEAQNVWIESLLSQVGYDFDKDKMILTKPELSVSLGMYRKYGNIATQMMELAHITVEQVEEMKKQEKAKQKESKKKKND